MEDDPDRPFWVADIGDDGPERWPWQPFLQDGGCCLPLPVWFATKTECEEFIASIPFGEDIQH
jgi:hypothetical protein